LRDDDLFHRIAECENDLIDLYVTGALSESDQKRLEAAFLQTPERRKRLWLSQALMNCSTQRGSVTPQKISQVRLSPVPWFRTVSARLAIGAALCLALAVTCAWLFLANRRLKGENQALREHDATMSQRAADLQTKADDSSKQLEATSQIPSGLRSVASFTLSSDAVRGSGKISELAIPPTTSLVQIHVSFP